MPDKNVHILLLVVEPVGEQVASFVGLIDAGIETVYLVGLILDQLGLTKDDLKWIDTQGLSIKTINDYLTAHYTEHVSTEPTPFYKVFRALTQGADRN